MNTTGIMALVLLGVIVITAVWIFLGSRKKQWYKVYQADGVILLLYRDLNERWWRTNDRYMRFKDKSGREVTFPSAAHWIIRWEEVVDNEVAMVEGEIYRMREQELARERDNG